MLSASKPHRHSKLPKPIFKVLPFMEQIFQGNNFPKPYALNTLSGCFLHQNFKYFLQNHDGQVVKGVSYLSKSGSTVHKCSMKKLFKCHKVHRKVLIEESLFYLHRCFPVSFAKFLKILVLQNTSVFLRNTLFCSLRRPQPQKMFPSTLFILNIFGGNTVDHLRTALSGSPRQSAVTKLIYC